MFKLPLSLHGLTMGLLYRACTTPLKPGFGRPRVLAWVKLSNVLKVAADTVAAQGEMADKPTLGLFFLSTSFRI